MASSLERASDSAIRPFFFGTPERQLLGLHHPPRGESRGEPRGESRGAFLICAPHGHEYIQFHRVCRLLAALLADAGFHVLRFDFAGCGDSAGEESAWGVESWSEDARLAADELRKRSGADRLGAVGLRLGGTIAMALGQGAGTGLQALVLWDAVHDGPAYLAELAQLQGDMLRYAHVKPERNSAPEVLGFALPAEFAEELRTIDAGRLCAPPAQRILVIESHSGAPQTPLCTALGTAGASFDHQSFSNPHLWVWTEDFAKVHVPRRILDAIVAWSCEAFAQ